MSNKFKILLAVVAAVLLVVGYRVFDNIQENREKAAKVMQSKTVTVETAAPERMTITPVLEFSGTLEPVWQAEIAAKVDGRIEKVYVKEGDRVTRGQVLALLEQDDTSADLLAAQGSYSDAQVNLRKAENDLKRYEMLYERGAVSQQAVDDFRYARDNAVAKLRSAQGVLEGMQSKSMGTVVTAPEDGIVYKRYYQEGYYAKAGTPLFAVADIRKLKTIIDIPEGQILGVHVGGEAEVTVAALDNKKIIGKIVRISPVADLPSHTFETEVGINNTEGILAGVFANVKMTAKPKENILTIPVYAIVMRDDQKTVFVVNDEGMVTRKVIDIGYSDDKIAEVLSGLNGDEVIVVGGQNKLREGSKVNISKAGA